VLAVAATAAAVGVVSFDSGLLWPAVLLVAAGPVGGYVLTRSMAVFFDDQAVGNWLEPLGLVSLFVETSLMVLCVGLMLARPVRILARESGAAVAGPGDLTRPAETVGTLAAAEQAGSAAQ